jgi:RNA polymerase sigma-70 factor (ECF subfamily)
VNAEEDDFHNLLDRARDGDQDAARILYTRYSSYVRAAVRRRLHPRLRRQYDSLDFVQDVWKSFLAAPGDRRQFDSPQALVGFLARVARNKVLEVVRLRFTTEKADITRELPLEAAGAGVPGREPTPSQTAIAGERWESLVGKFPNSYRVILERLRAGYTYEEIAQQAGVSLSTINRIVRRLKDLGGV